MITLQDIKKILSESDPAATEKLAREAKQLTEQYFGRTISLYAPLYLSNYCSSHCTYCGFSAGQKISRVKLSPEEIKREMAVIARTGIENILLLTGESYRMTPLPYLRDAVAQAKEHFSNISLEVHPLQENEYRELFEEGVDGVTVYQETYDRLRYREVHPSGIKSDYDFRYGTPERAARAGIRQISLGVLLGLGPVSEDLLALYRHLRALEKNYPGVEYSLSFPRIRSVKGVDRKARTVDDISFLKIICLSRVLFPRVGINLSTRESVLLRDHALGLGVTRISAGSRTTVGGYAPGLPGQSDPQFDVDDNRPVETIVDMLKGKDFDPVLTDWRRIGNAV